MDPTSDKRAKNAGYTGDDRDRPGDTIAGKYELLRRLGEGAMGTVWVARNTALEVDVAIKLVKVHGSRMQAQRLVQEARAAARLIHPSIVRLYDFGTTEAGDPYIVMELVHGEELASLMNKEGRISAVRAVQLMLPIADALATAHDKGIIHRDFKPENVMLSRDEKGRMRPKLLDFGIARVTNVRKRRITLAGAVVGTPDYMSPEQARGEGQIDHRTDIWAFSVVLYELVAGRRPFRGENYHALLKAILEKDPTPITDLAAGDADLWRVLQAGLHKDREERWDSLHALGEALALWLYERGVREDVCATSLKTSWLSAGLSGVKIHVPPSVPPPAAMSVGQPPGGKAQGQRASKPPGPRRRASSDERLRVRATDDQVVPPPAPILGPGEIDVVDEPSQGPAVVPTRDQPPSRLGRGLAVALIAVVGAVMVGFIVAGRSSVPTDAAVAGPVVAPPSPAAPRAPAREAGGTVEGVVAPPSPPSVAIEPGRANPAPASSGPAGASESLDEGAPSGAHSGQPYVWPPPSAGDRVKAWKKPGVAPEDYQFGF